MNAIVIVLVFFASSFAFDTGGAEVVRGTLEVRLRDELRVPVKVRLRIEDDDECAFPFNQSIDLSSRAARGKCYARLAEKIAPRRKGPIHFLIPPIVLPANGAQYIVGKAEAICRRRGSSYSVGEYFNQLKQMRLTHTVIAALHELGHTLGASHDSGIMQIDPLPAADKPLTFSKFTRREVKRCISGWKL